LHDESGQELTQVVKLAQQRSDELIGDFMFILINAFLIGTASGLRALIGLATVSWAAHFRILALVHTWLAFLILVAIGELVMPQAVTSQSVD
jgi:putative Mn2+ efflux pump MntP